MMVAPQEKTGIVLLKFFCCSFYKAFYCNFLEKTFTMKLQNINRYTFKDILAPVLKKGICECWGLQFITFH